MGGFVRGGWGRDGQTLPTHQAGIEEFDIWGSEEKQNLFNLTLNWAYLFNKKKDIVVNKRREAFNRKMITITIFRNTTLVRQGRVGNGRGAN